MTIIVRLGADPETFIKDSKGKHLSVIGMIGANKWAPMQVPNLPDGFTLQEDNVALEFGQPPAASEEEFVFNTRTAMLAGLSKLPGKRFSRLSCVVFDADQMDNPMAHQFGCEPDFNAWEDKENAKPVPPHPNLRSAGGHIHIELPQGFTKEQQNNVVRAMDLYAGVPSILMDSGKERRQLYGKAGACRYKPYGVEYRTLSNFWIYKKHLTRWAWRQAQRAANADFDQVNFFRDEIQHCINESCVEEAKYLVQHLELEVV